MRIVQTSLPSYVSSQCTIVCISNTGHANGSELIFLPFAFSVYLLLIQVQGQISNITAQLIFSYEWIILNSLLIWFERTHVAPFLHQEMI